MRSERMDVPLAEEFKRLRDRFEELSRSAPPATLCLVKAIYDPTEPRKHGEFPCPPPPDPWLSLVERGEFDTKIELDLLERVVERALIRCADLQTWKTLTNLATQTGRLVKFVPHDAWIRDTMWITLALPTEKGWRWFNTVFDLALDIPRPRFLAVDNEDRGGFFWWVDQDGARLLYHQDHPDVRNHMRRTGRWGAVITDMAVQSMHAIDLILSRSGPVENPRGGATGAVGERDDATRRGTNYTKEEQAAWWYEWLCKSTGTEFNPEEAYECFQKLAAEKEPFVHTPWSQKKASWLSSKISLETFKKYLERARLKKQQRPRFAEGSSVVSSLPKSGTLRDDARVVPPEVLTGRHGKASQLRNAAADQAARDAEAAAFGVEPPIDSQGDPL
jgi:hypothetical protein